MKIQNNPTLSAELIKALGEQHALQSQLEVTREAYSQAVQALLDVALTETGQSEPVANLLLSLHDSYSYHFPLADLCRLDLALVHRALVAIRGRVLLSMEPHEVIPNGEQRFAFLCAEYAYLNIDRRYNKDGR